MTSKVCQTCGIVFTGGPRAWYCPECRHARRIEKMRGYNAAIAAGTTRKLGSTSICESCGKPYTVMSGNQKWCSDCRPEMLKKLSREMHRKAAKPPATEPPESKPAHKPKKDLTGQTFGRLTALRYVGRSRWECKCDCGNVCTVQTCNLTNGHTQSCGCIAKEQSAINGAKVKDLTGQRFGKLVAIRYLGKSCWELECDCGNLTTAHQGNLHKGQKTSCGCAVSLDNANRKNIVGGTNVGNIRSTTLSKRNTSGVKGVHFCKTRQLWIATIGFQGRQYTLKASKDKTECISARLQAEERIFGDFLEWYENHKKEENK